MPGAFQFIPQEQICLSWNDGVIRLWKLDGRQVGELIGHENFIYSLVSLPSGELASQGGPNCTDMERH